MSNDQTRLVTHHCESLAPAALLSEQGSVPAEAKWTFTTRRVNRADARGLSRTFAGAVAGDLILVRTLEIGQHKNVQLAEGRNAENIVGDYVVALVGDRYAPDQFEGLARIDPDDCSIVAAGGIVGQISEMNANMLEPTRVEPVGLLTDTTGEVLNVASYGIPDLWCDRVDEVTVIAVFGTAMNSGKTTTAASLALGLRRGGYQVTGIKATGTGAFGDYNAFRNAGVPVLDFVDAGMGTTYRMPHERVERAFEALVHSAAEQGADIVVVEFADGVFQQEAAEMLSRGQISARLDGVLFAAYDSAGAIAGVSRLQRHGLTPLALSGYLSVSPLAMRETVSVTGIPVLTIEQLRDAASACSLISPCERAPVGAVKVAA